MACGGGCRCRQGSRALPDTEYEDRSGLGEQGLISRVAITTQLFYAFAFTTRWGHGGQFGDQWLKSGPHGISFQSTWVRVYWRSENNGFQGGFSADQPALATSWCFEHNRSLPRSHTRPDILYWEYNYPRVLLSFFSQSKPCSPSHFRGGVIRYKRR